MNVSQIMTREVVTVAPDCRLDKIIRLFESSRFRHLPVVAEGALVGILSDRDIALATGWIPAASRQGSSGKGPKNAEQIMRSEVRTLGPEASLAEAVAVVLDHRVGAVPITAGGQLVGLVTTTDLLRSGSASEAASVEDAMTREVCTAEPTTTLVDAIELCAREVVRHLPVVEGQRLVGIVSDRDLRFGLGREIVSDSLAQDEGRLEVPRTTLAALMSREVVTIAPEESLERAAELMLEHGFSALPVLGAGRLAGILTNTDILRSRA